jgi:hypothetical protein
MALTTLSDFKSELKYGARSNLFKVKISVPSITLTTDKLATTATTLNGIIDTTTDGNDVELLCKAAAIPSFTLGTIEVPFRGRRIKIPGDRSFGDWTATFMADDAHKIRQLFLEWANYIKYHDETTDLLGSTKNDYYSSIDIQHLKSNNTVSRYYKLYEVFPTEVGAIDLSYDSTDTLEEFTVTFQYHYLDSSSSAFDASSTTAAAGGTDVATSAFGGGV